MRSLKWLHEPSASDKRGDEHGRGLGLGEGASGLKWKRVVLVVGKRLDCKAR